MLLWQQMHCALELIQRLFWLERQTVYWPWTVVPKQSGFESCGLQRLGYNAGKSGANANTQRRCFEAIPDWHLVWDAEVSHRWINWPVAQMAQGLCERLKANGNIYCNCLNCFASALTWFLTRTIFVWTGRFLLGILVRIGSSCYEMLLVCIWFWHFINKFTYLLTYLFSTPQEGRQECDKLNASNYLTTATWNSCVGK